MSIILRVWKELKESKESKESKVSLQTNWTIWDRGDEMWELRGDVLRHFEILDRSNINNVITERLRPLRESAIPLEAIRHSIQGWEVEESIDGVNSVKPSPQVKPAPPLTSSPPSIPTLSPRKNDPLKVLQSSPKASKKQVYNSLALNSHHHVANIAVAAGANVSGENVSGANAEMKLTSLPAAALEEISHREKPLQEAQVTLEEESSQHFYNHPMELWSSLSQWIPQHALFQPSLHHQATLELSDTPAQTYPYQIDSSKNSRHVQGQHQHVKQGQQSRPYRPKTSLREIEIPKRPLFV